MVKCVHIKLISFSCSVILFRVPQKQVKTFNRALCECYQKKGRRCILYRFPSFISFPPFLPSHFFILSMLIYLAFLTLFFAHVYSYPLSSSLIKREQPDAPPTPGIDLNPLEWGDLNFIHTTDIHGNNNSTIL